MRRIFSASSQAIRTLSGTAHGPHDLVVYRSRRGSVLIVILGALALMSVLAAIYVTIGQQDRRVAAAITRQTDLLDIETSISGYVSDVIRDDLFDVYPVPAADNTGNPTDVRYFRELVDSPRTSFHFRSVTPGNGNQRLVDRFRPTGGLGGDEAQQFAGDPRISLRAPSDPWLASTTPTWLGGVLDSTDTARVYSEGNQRRWYLDNRDWLQISNIAPDGRFVNLWNLRNNFDVVSGIEDGEISDNLFLLTLDGDGRVRATESLPDGTAITRDVRNIPAHFTMYQKNMFFPLNQPFQILDTNGAQATWSSPAFPDYSYADTDGDGFADSRWSELVDSSDPMDPRPLLNDERFRIFVAARIIDLSSMANINSATDSRLVPTNEVPLGMTPSEVDIRRLLSMDDQASMFDSPFTTDPLSYADTEQPKRFDGGIGSFYKNYTADAEGRDGVASLVGKLAYDSLGRSIHGFADLSGFRDQARFQASNDPLRDDVSRFQSTWWPNGNNNDEGEARRAQADYYDFVGKTDPTSPFGRPWSDASVNEAGGALFGLDDLGELLTYYGLNDPDAVSRLERIVGGRLADSGGLADVRDSFERLSPLRSGRDLELERLLHDNDPGTLQRVTGQRPDVSDGLIDFDSMAMIALSPRQFITTVSGAREIRPLSLELDEFNIFANNEDNFDEFEGKIEILELLEDIVDGDESVGDLFQIYADALLPHSDALNAWDPNNTPMLTLAYGHRGPALAQRIAGHMTLNLLDSYDEDSVPTAVALIADVQAEGRLGVTEIEDRYPWPELDLGDDRLANGEVVREDEQIVNIYGIEAQPFITEVASMTIYVDAHPDAGGDNDTRSPGPGDIDPGDPEGTFANFGVSIDTRIDEMNSDLAMQILVFELTNPFDRPISLGSRDSLDEEGTITPTTDFRYYIEFGGDYYVLGEYEPEAGNPTTSVGNVVLDPGETRTFYVTAHNDLEALELDWRNHLTGYGLTPDDIIGEGIEGWIESQLGDPNNTENTPIRIARFDPFGNGAARGEIIEEFNHLLAPEVPATTRTEREYRNVVRLWQKLEPTRGDTTEFGRSKESQDFLADRLRLDDVRNTYNVNGYDGASRNSANGWFGLLDTRFRPEEVNFGWGSISSHTAFNENAGRDADPEDFPAKTGNGRITMRQINTGWTIVRTASVRRRGQTEEITGSLPAWCIEAIVDRNGTIRSLNDSALLDDRGSSDTEVESLEYELLEVFNDDNEEEENGQTVFRGRAYRGFEFFLREGDNAFIRTLGNPDNGLQLPRRTFVDGNSTAGQEALLQVEYGEAPNNGPWQDRTHAAPIWIDDNQFQIRPFTEDGRTVLRPADLLLPMGIGPVFMPDGMPGTIGDDIASNIDENEWVTLGEAVALAFGYNDRFLDQTDGVLGQIVTNGPDTTPRRTVLDRGQLRLDRYIAFVDGDSNGIYEPEVGASDEFAPGPAVPMAFGILDQIYTLGPDQEDVLAEKITGKININTAPIEVLRLLPGLTPLATFDSGGNAEWFGADPNLMGMNLPRLTAGDEFENPDVAATMISYRDRVSAPFRDRSYDLNSRGEEFGYYATDNNGAGLNAAAALAWREDNFIGEFGRQRTTGILGLRSEPGFSSPAEVLAVVDNSAFDIAVPNISASTIAQYGVDQVELGVEDFDMASTNQVISLNAFLHADPMGTTNTVDSPRTENDELVDDYRELLSSANGIMNLISVRSDVYAAWFVVRGYAQADVVGLADEDPMIPSFEKRYLMVVDRSNVQRLSDEPRVLLFREVPR